MRVSDASQFDAMSRQLSNARQAASLAQEQASSGVRVSKPSDDPTAAAAIRLASSRKALADAGKAASDAATAQLQGSDDALNNVYNALTSARDAALQASSGTSSAEDRASAANEVRSIRDQIVALANTNVNGNYVFGGYSDQSPPYDATGSYSGDQSVKHVQVLPGFQVSTSIPGTQVFGSGGTDMFSQLSALASALDANDTAGIQSSYTALQTNQSDVLTARSKLGGMMNTVTIAASVASRASSTAQAEASQVGSIDEVTAASNLVQAQSALQKAITIAAQIPQNSLVEAK